MANPPAPPAADGAAQRRLVPIVCPGHSRPLAELHYRNTSDGLFLISACLDKMPMLRNGVTGDWIGTFAGHKGAVWSAKLNVGATRAATASADFSVKLWDAITGKDLHTFDHQHIVKTVDFTEDGAKLLSGGQKKKLRVFDLNNFSSDPIVVDHPDTIRKGLWTADGSAIVTGGGDGCVRVWDVRSMQEVRSASVGGEGKNKEVADIELDHERNLLTVACGKSVQFLDLATMAVVKRFEMEVDANSASLHAGGKHFAAGGSDMWVRLFDYETGKEIECNKGHHGPVHCLRFSPLGDTYTSGAGDATIRIWQSAKLPSA
jgi:serine-threonine kinase receptor-associated protein